MNQKLRRLRILAGLTHKEAAAKIGVSASNISHWERERTFPRVNRLPKIAEAYGCTVADLLDDNGTDNKNPPVAAGNERRNEHDLATMDYCGAE